MSEKARSHSEGGLESGADTPEISYTREELHRQAEELQYQGIRTLTDYNVLLDSPEGGKYAAFMGAIKMILELLTTDLPQRDKKEKQEENDSETGSRRSHKTTERTEAGAESKKITERLEEKKRELGKERETATAFAEEKEKISQRSVFYVGDSYMASMTRGRPISNKEIGGNKHAVGSRPLIAYGKGKYNEKWGGNDVETVAHKALDNPECKTLVLTGGLNDFYTFPDPEAVYKRVKSSYEQIIKRAKNRPRELGGPVRVVICKIPKIKRIPAKKDSREPDYDRKRRINYYTDLLNDELDKEWILNTDTNIALVDTNGAIGNNWGDSIHPNKKGYEALYDEIQEKII